MLPGPAGAALWRLVEGGRALRQLEAGGAVEGSVERHGRGCQVVAQLRLRRDLRWFAAAAAPALLLAQTLQRVRGEGQGRRGRAQSVARLPSCGKYTV